LQTKDSQAKRHRQSLRRRMKNRIIKSQLKTATKHIQDLVAENKKEETQAAIREYASMVDSAVTKGIFHRNNAARKKSGIHNLAKKLK
jgi:small subunit ribosomal protein S20